MRRNQLGKRPNQREVIVGDGERRKRYILCYNPKEAERQCKHREEVVALLERELKDHTDDKATKQWAIELCTMACWRHSATFVELREKSGVDYAHRSNRACRHGDPL